MEIKNLLPAIVALLIVTSILSISTISVSATTSSTIDKTLVKANTPMILTVTVSSTTALDNVRIIFDNGSGFVPLSTIPKDNIVKCAVDNIVVLPEGTVVQLLENENILLPENTNVWVDNGQWIVVEALIPYPPSDTQLKQNAEVEVRQDTVGENIPLGDNIQVTRRVSVNLNIDNQLRLLADTPVTVVGGNIVKLPENTLLGLVAPNDNSQISVWENVEVTENITVTLNDNHVRMVTDKPINLRGFDIPTGENIQLKNNIVIVTAGTTVQLGKTVNVRIAENENVIREKDKLLDATGQTVKTQPENWAQTTGTTDPLGNHNFVEWKGIGDNKIAVNGSLQFPFSLTTPATTEDRTTLRFWVRTPTGIEGPIVLLKVDGKNPTVTVTASPTTVKDNTAVTITVVASEVLAKLDNVMVAENNAPVENQISMTSSDNITWTGTYTTGDNWLRDGTATVSVINSQFEDLAGNVGSGVSTDNTFTVDRENPPMPNLGDTTEITGLPVDLLPAAPGIQTCTGAWLIDGYAKDNFRNKIENLANGTAVIRVGTTTYNVTASATGYFYQSITLSQGTQEVGIKYIDLAGNVGDENAENVTFDNIPPVITPNTISGKALVDGVIINDNTPTVKLSFTDATLGIENMPFDNTDNSGYSVQLWDENDNLIATLVNATPPTTNMPNTISFENTYQTVLSDGTYSIYAVAGDNLQMDNLVISFVIDTKAPAAPAVAVPISQDPSNPDIKRTTSVSLGGTCEPYATVRIWTSQAPFVSETNVDNVVDTAGSGTWTANITVPEGVEVRIRVSAVDFAGNESTKATYGYLMVDATAPTVSITTPASGTKTDKASISVSGTVTKDAWEDWTDITLRVQVGLTSTTVPISAGSFSVNVPLGEGSNTIIATATDAVGNSSTDSVTVERTVTSWAIYAIILVIIALILAAIAIFRMR